jgi:hypothetical protein
MIAGVESGSTLRGSLVVVHAIPTGIPLLENFFPFHWKFCVLITYALNECLIIMRYLVTSLVLEPSACTILLHGASHGDPAARAHDR